MTSRLMIDIADEMGEMIDLFVLHLDLWLTFFVVC